MPCISLIPAEFLIILYICSNIIIHYKFYFLSYIFPVICSQSFYSPLRFRELSFLTGFHEFIILLYKEIYTCYGFHSLVFCEYPLCYVSY